MGIYIGYYGPDPEFYRASQERARTQGTSQDPEFQRLVTELRANLPPTLKLIGSYSPINSFGPDSDVKAVWICETDNLTDLRFVNEYYAGYLRFNWIPAVAIGTSPAETEQYFEALLDYDPL